MISACRRFAPTALAALSIMGLSAACAQARDGSVTSFDGTVIAYHFYPAHGLAAGAKAPSVMMGPGYSSGGASETNDFVARLRDHGFNVMTWDPRGFGASGGTVETDSPAFEGRDTQALVDRLAQQPEVQLDKPGDPRFGMVGGSYGGGIQNVLAAIDDRVDAIAPQIAWHSLITSLDKNGTPKTGWGTVLYGVGTEGSTLIGLTDQQFGRQQDPQTTHAILTGAATGAFTKEDTDYFAARGPGDELISKIKVPTLLSQGTDDTLFTLHEAIANYTAGRRAGVPIAMDWFCGGLTDPSSAHGVCLTPKGPQPAIAVDQAVDWMLRWVKGDTSVDTGAGFRWVSDTGALHYAKAWPVPHGDPVIAEGAGSLAIAPGDTSGDLVAATPALNALTIPLPALATGTELLGEPSLAMTYSGTAAAPAGVVYAQLVDTERGLAVGNQVTPIPVTLDGKEHTTTLPLEAIALDATAGSTYTLQITGGTSVYFAARQPALLSVQDARLTIPTVAPGASSDDPKAFGNPTLPAAGCARTVTVRLRRGHVLRARIVVDGRRVRTVRHGHLRRVRVRVHGAGRHTVRVVVFGEHHRVLRRITRHVVTRTSSGARCRNRPVR